jgi:hypothetical protein
MLHPTLDSALRRLAQSRPELGIVFEGGAGFAPFGPVLPGDVIEAWLSATTSLTPGIDRKTAAAYLLSILVWRLGDILGALYLEGVPLPSIGPQHIAIAVEARGSGRMRQLDSRFAFDIGAVGQGLDRPVFVQSVVDIHAPLIEALHLASGLGREALWRLVTDGLTMGLLTHGQRHGMVDLARAEAEAICALPPLANPQWGFVEIRQGDAAEWFRFRGGCCRLYKADGQELCTTCVLRPRAEQVARLETLVRLRNA